MKHLILVAVAAALILMAVNMVGNSSPKVQAAQSSKIAMLEAASK